jgi:hypothetical protein
VNYDMARQAAALVACANSKDLLLKEKQNYDCGANSKGLLLKEKQNSDSCGRSTVFS